MGIEPTTSCFVVKRSTDWANPAAVQLRDNYFIFNVLSNKFNILQAIYGAT